MANYMLMALLDPPEDLAEQLSGWLGDIHIPEVMETRGFKSVVRYEAVHDEAFGNVGAFRYMQVYDVETDDVGQALNDFDVGRATRTPPPFDLDRVRRFTAFYRRMD